MNRVSIVVPVYHSARSLPELMERLAALADRNRQDEFEFVFVDDGSRDNSFEVLKELLSKDERVRIDSFYDSVQFLYVLVKRLAS